jgi:methylenetetrahydrofolate dehydrogenase (NADP+)/methenyltetrahydrofolate cyclohydrolase
MAIILDGKALAEKIRKEIRLESDKIFTEKNIRPGLAVIIAGDDPASAIYVRNKERAALEVGFHSQVERYPADVSQEELLAAIDRLNKDEKIHGMIVQLPLPKHLNEKELLNAINPAKDADGLHPLNLGLLAAGDKSLVSCTPKGCMRLIEETGIDISGKKAVVVGRSNMVGKPVALLLLQANATVTICHSRTKDLKEELKDADIVVAAVGIPALLTGQMIKEGAIVIDVGINRLDDGSLCGDIDFASVAEKASYVTPVPGGVGPMTIAMLLSNTLEAFKNGY